MDEKRPETPESGVPLEKECNIQHRSDLLMEHHIQNVKQTQDEVKIALRDLEHARSEKEIEKLQAKVHELQKKSEWQMTTLQVMHKLNTELQYARADLDEALYNGNGDINTARKRVIWLEDRMGALCGKKRLKSRPSVHQLAINVHMIGPEEGAEQDTSRKQTDKMVDGMALTLYREGSTFSSDTERSPRLRYSSSIFTPDKPISTGRSQTDIEEMKKKLEELEKEKVVPDAEYKEDEEEEFTDKESEPSDEIEGEGRGEESPRSDVMVCSAEHLSEEEEKVDQESDKMAMDQKTEDIFLTEVAVTPKSKVTMQTPRTLEKSQTLPEFERDPATEYWESEHHRYEKSDFSEVLCEIDPSSYHSVHLAIPGCFIKKEESIPDFHELPWKSNLKDTDIKDIHRIALDKLAVKVHSMYDKVYSAAMLSVNLCRKPADQPREKSFFTNRENNLLSREKKEVTSRPTSDDSRSGFILPEIEPRRLKTTASRHLVYYPKPIPPPEVLPITRTNKSHEFPKFASFFGDPDEAQQEPAVRIVDQRNLLEETRLVLYREKKKPKKSVLSTNEKRFRRMIEREKTAGSKASSKKLRKTFRLAKSMAQLRGGISGWPAIKPKTKGNEYSGLRWERVKEVVHNNLMSEKPEERKDAAKQLGALRCGDTMVFYALKQRLTDDDDMRVRFEAAKTLILLGCWEEDVLQVVLKFLLIGNSDIRSDLIHTMMNGKNVQYVHKSLSVFVELVKVLSHFCRNPDPDDMTSFDAAVLLGRLCVADNNAKKKLKDSLQQNHDTHIISKALEVLVKQLNCTDPDVVHHVQKLLKTSPCWKHRELAARLLISLGPGHPCVMDDYENIYGLLERKLWDDPNPDVRIASAKALTALGMFTRACESTEKKLENAEEDIRAQAAIAVGTLGMKSEKLTRLLLEMLELDSSEYVRLMIVRSFATLKLADKRVIRTLKEREKLDGPLARESKKTLLILEKTSSCSTPKTMTPNTMTPCTTAPSSRATRITA